MTLVTDIPGPIRIGISACLLGDEVRYDGGHKRDPYLVETFGRFVEWVKVCPEVECGMGIPRPAVRLVTRRGRLRMVTTGTDVDHTDAMTRYATRRVEELAGQDLCGYVLKKDSPSCGMERVKVHDTHGIAARSGTGLFARVLITRFPHLPIEEEGRLSDPRLRDNFVERVFAYRRARSLFDGRWTASGLARFHTRHELVLMAHSGPAYRSLGRLVARASSLSRAVVRDRYMAGFMEALSVIATPRHHVNVLRHMVGCFKKMDHESRAELLTAIKYYRNGLLPLIVPLTLIRRHVRRHEVSRLAGQVYLEPHPVELMLRHQV